MHHFQLGGLRLTHIGHASFKVKDLKGHTVLLDPFYADSFPWGDHTEIRLTPARERPEDIERCDAIFVSHDHADHWDPAAVAAIMARTPAVLCAPKSVVNDAIERGLDDLRTFVVRPHDWFAMGDEEDLRVGIIPDASCGDDTNPDKVSFLLKAGDTAVFYCGDCHSVPPALQQFAGEVDAIAVWFKLELIDRFVADIRPKTIILMHYDEFEPGALPCCKSPDRMRQAILERHPALEVLDSGLPPSHNIKTG